MTEKEANSAAATPKKGKSPAKAKKPKTAPSHPKVSDMVNSAITVLKERGGSSLVAIKKYISATYKVDAEKLSPFIKKYLKSSVVSGGLVQTKGKGANGSFRMGGAASGGATKKSAVKAKAKKTATKPKTAKTAATPKKAAKPKKSPAKSKPKKSVPAKKSKPVAVKAAAKKAKPAKSAAKKKPAKASPKKKAAAKKGKK